MTINNEKPLFIDLDLAFHPFTQSINVENILLNNSQSWHEKFKCWLLFILKNDRSYLPKSIISFHHLSIGLHLVDDETMVKINHEWRQKALPTDVLSFPAIDQDTLFPVDVNSAELGDIIVSVPTAIKQAKENKHSLTKELCWLASHGLLHLLGWDHPNDTRLDEMLNFQDKLLKINCELFRID